MLDVSNEVIIVLSDDEMCVRNSSKLISIVSSKFNINNIKLLLNKIRVVKSLKRKCLSENDISEILGNEIIYSIPKLYNFKKEFDKYISKLSYSIVLNKNFSYDFYSKYKGIFGFIRRIKYARYE